MPFDDGIIGEEFIAAWQDQAEHTKILTGKSNTAIRAALKRSRINRPPSAERGSLRDSSADPKIVAWLDHVLLFAIRLPCLDGLHSKRSLFFLA